MVFRRGTRNVGSRSAEGRLPETGLLSYSGDQLLAHIIHDRDQL